VFEGSLQTQNSICIEGVFKGRLECKGRVILNKSGNLEADIIAANVSIRGKVTGNITVLEQLDIGATGVVHGDVRSASVTVEKGGVLDGTCKMLSESEAEAFHSTVPWSRNLRAEDEAEVAEGETLHDEGNGSCDPVIPHDATR
jgi:cytoskeletal protein CcmA (bactofilin family)